MSINIPADMTDGDPYDYRYLLVRIPVGFLDAMWTWC
jgi:hypothetical protein